MGKLFAKLVWIRGNYFINLGNYLKSGNSNSREIKFMGKLYSQRN